MLAGSLLTLSSSSSRHLSWCIFFQVTAAVEALAVSAVGGADGGSSGVCWVGGGVCCVIGVSCGGAGAACAGENDGAGSLCGAGAACAGENDGADSLCGAGAACAGGDGGIGTVESGDAEGGIDVVEGVDAAVEGEKARGGIAG